jgi:hypothetical protein
VHGLPPGLIRPAVPAPDKVAASFSDVQICIRRLDLSKTPSMSWAYRLLIAVTGKERRQSMSVKASSHSRIKTIKVICDRCKQIVEGIRGEEFTAGFYDMTKWEEYRRENEQYVCDSCMFADPKYVARYGSCF